MAWNEMVTILLGGAPTPPAFRWASSTKHSTEDVDEEDEAPDFGEGTAVTAQERSGWIDVNTHGCRIGDSHHNAKLSDVQVQQLLIDRGPRSAPTMSLSALAKKWGLSKSGVKAIVDGRNRGQWGTHRRRERSGEGVVPTRQRAS